MSLTSKQVKQLNDGLVTSKMGLGTIISGLESTGAGITVVGGTGGIGADKFVRISGYDTDEDAPVVTLADADAVGTARDVYYCPAAIAEGAVGTAYQHYSITGVNTDAGNAGDPVYLSGTAGAWTLTEPSGTAAIVEIGTISVKHATTGVINVQCQERVLPHDHSDDANGGALSAQSNLAATSATTFTLNSGGSQLILSSSGQTGNHTVTFPDATGVAVFTNGAQTLAGKTLNAPTIAGGLTLSGANSVTGTWTNLGTVTTADINGGTIDGATIGGASAAAGTFTTATATTITDGTVSLSGGSITGTWANLGTVTTVNIDGGTVDGATIGGATPGAGTFTTATANTALVLAANANASCAAGTTAVDLSLGTGTFKSTTGAHTLGGAVTIADATTPSLTTASGKTNTGFVQVNGKTTGGIKLTCADAAVAVVTISAAAQTNAQTITIPDTAGAGKYMAFGDSAGNVAAANLAAAVQDMVPYLATPAFTNDEDGTGSMSFQVKDAGGNNLSGRFLIRVWIGTADDYGVDAVTGLTVSTGTQKQAVTANGELLVITDANGAAVVDINNGGAGTVYMWAELGGKIVASGASSITA